MIINAYLNFDGNCREAIGFYASVFGVEMDLQKTFWSRCYGSLTDKFGVPWQFNHRDECGCPTGE